MCTLVDGVNQRLKKEFYELKLGHGVVKLKRMGIRNAELGRKYRGLHMANIMWKCH